MTRGSFKMTITINKKSITYGRKSTSHNRYSLLVIEKVVDSEVVVVRRRAE